MKGTQLPSAKHSESDALAAARRPRALAWACGAAAACRACRQGQDAQLRKAAQGGDGPFGFAFHFPVHDRDDVGRRSRSSRTSTTP